MAAILNFSALTTDQQRLIQKIVMDKVLNNPLFNIVHTMYPGIKAGDRLGFAGEFGLMMKAQSACGAKTPHVGTSAGETIVWAPNKWEIFLRECGTDLQPAIQQWTLKFGTDAFNPAGTGYEEMLAEVLAKGFIKNLWRSAWMNDKTAANVGASPAGVITAGVDTAFFTWMDGYFKLLFTAVGVNPLRRSTLAANAQATFALQDSVFDAAAGYAILNAVETEADPILRDEDGAFFLCTKSVEDRYRWYLESKGQLPAYILLTDGSKALDFRGKPLIAIPYWDSFIRAYESNGTKYNYPHRVVFTTKENLAAGTQDTDVFDRFEMFYDMKEDYNYTKALSDLDVHVLRSFMFQFGY
jgi:hypothetical protein